MADDLNITKHDLNNTKHILTQTTDDLNNTKQILTRTTDDLSHTKQSLTRATDSLTRVSLRLNHCPRPPRGCHTPARAPHRVNRVFSYGRRLFGPLVTITKGHRSPLYHTK